MSVPTTAPLRGVTADPCRIAGTSVNSLDLGEMCSVDHDGIHADIFAWITPRLRQLPWRDERDPWKILVSEVMLQQTSVSRVLGKWELFVEAFPSPRQCAEAELGEVLRLWQGLGYPRRARNLQRAAQIIEVNHSGRVPADVEALMELPGVGPYTARAVVAFAFEGDAAAVDTNVARILRRWTGEPLAMRDVQRLADRLLPDGEAWLWNQAMMDLGATVCRTKPLCDTCPLIASCRWRGSGTDPSEAVVRSRQARFEGSGRQARGRLLKALLDGPVAVDDVAAVMGRPQETAADLAEALLDEGLIKRVGANYEL